MSAAALYIAYDGAALESHEMDVRVLAPALLAFSDMFEEANAVLNGYRAKAHLNIRGSFKTGSFGCEFSIAQSFIQSLLDFGSSTPVVSVISILTLLGFIIKGSDGVLQVLRKLRGQKVTKIEVNGKHATLYVDKEHITIEERVLKLLNNERIRGAFEDAIAKPLEIDGIDSFGFTDNPDNQESLVVINRSEASSFHINRFSSGKTGTSEYDISLKIMGISFQDNNKWKFFEMEVLRWYRYSILRQHCG